MDKIKAWALWVFGILAGVLGTPELVQKVYAAFQTGLEHTPAGDIHLASWVPIASSLIGAALSHYIYVRNPGVSDPVKSLHAGVLKKLTLLLLVGFALICVDTRPACAYDFNLPSKAFKSCATAPAKKSLSLKSAIPSGLDTDAIVAMPLAAFSVGTVQTSYGISVAYCISYGHLTGASGSSTTSYRNYVGIGAAAYLDAGDWLKSSFESPLKFKGGAGVLLPELCGVTPSVEEVWSPLTGGRETLISLNAPFSLINAATYLLKQL
jgi:hypothetical protein